MNARWHFGAPENAFQCNVSSENLPVYGLNYYIVMLLYAETIPESFQKVHNVFVAINAPFWSHLNRVCGKVGQVGRAINFLAECSCCRRERVVVLSLESRRQRLTAVNELPRHWSRCFCTRRDEFRRSDRRTSTHLDDFEKGRRFRMFGAMFPAVFGNEVSVVEIRRRIPPPLKNEQN